MSERPGSETPRERGEARRTAPPRAEGEIARHERRIDEHPPSAEDVGRALPDAVRRESKRGDRLARALVPTIEGAVRESVRRDPKALADGISPSLGHALRKSFRAWLATLVQRSSRAVEHAFSPRSLRWRVHAWRTHRTFDEIELSKTWVYRIEHVLLLRTDSGAPVRHVAHPGLATHDPELVAGTRAALDDFVRASFAKRSDEAREQAEPREHVEYGDRTLELVRGPRWSLAVHVRGQPPRELRRRMQALLDELHAKLVELEGEHASDESIVAEVEPLLERALEAQARESTRKSRTPLVVAALGVTALVLLAVWGGSTRARRVERFELIANVLRTAPGYVVLAAERNGERMSFEGLRDPLASSPEELASAAGLELQNATFTFEPFVSLDAPIVARRLLAALAPPPGVVATIVDDRVVLTGRASHAWIVLARALATAFADSMARADATARAAATRLDERGLVDLEREALQKAVAALDRRTTWGASGPTTSDSTHRSSLETLRAELEQLDRLARAAERDVEVRVVVNGPPTPEELAESLGRSRFERCKLRCEDAAAAQAGTGKTLPLTAGSFGITVSIVDESP